jgi:hypothetical protein
MTSSVGKVTIKIAGSTIINFMSNTAEDLNYRTKNILLEHPADWYIQ